MDPLSLRYETMRDLYQSQRSRREQIRGSVATPVSAMAFTVFNLSTLATNINIQNWTYPANFVIVALLFLSVIFLLAGAAFIVLMEKGFFYVDPPDLTELVEVEKKVREKGVESEEAVAQEMQNVLSGSYDIIYRWYFSANEQAARDRTKGIRLILSSLTLIVIAYTLLPFQA